MNPGSDLRAWVLPLHQDVFEHQNLFLNIYKKNTSVPVAKNSVKWFVALSANTLGTRTKSVPAGTR